MGHVVGRLVSTGQRFIAHHGDVYTLAQLSNGLKEAIGRRGSVRPAEKGINLFVFQKDSVL